MGCLTCVSTPTGTRSNRYSGLQDHAGVPKGQSHNRGTNPTEPLHSQHPTVRIDEDSSRSLLEGYKKARCGSLGTIPVAPSCALAIHRCSDCWKSRCRCLPWVAVASSLPCRSSVKQRMQEESCFAWRGREQDVRHR